MFRELTIGSYVNFRNNMVKITAITKDFVTFGEGAENKTVSITEIKAIPISKELLLEYGFEELTDRHYAGLERKISLKLSDATSGNLWILKLYSVGQPVLITSVQYLHQIQAYLLNQGLELNMPEKDTDNDCHKKITGKKINLDPLDDGKTFYQLLRELKDWRPKDRHVTSEKEFNEITEHFKLKYRTHTDLRNLRDTCVAYYTTLLEDETRRDNAMLAMMSLTAVIDRYIYKTF